MALLQFGHKMKAICQNNILISFENEIRNFHKKADLNIMNNVNMKFVSYWLSFDMSFYINRHLIEMAIYEGRFCSYIIGCMYSGLFL